MTGEQIQTLMQERGIGSGMAEVKAVIVDQSYDLPTREFITGPFAIAMRANLVKLGVDRYVAEKNDCDDFGLICAALARVDQNLSTGRLSSLAFGFLQYIQQQTWPPGGHQINFFIALEEGKHQVVFFEPQTMQEVILTQEEIASISMYYV